MARALLSAASRDVVAKVTTPPVSVAWSGAT